MIYVKTVAALLVVACTAAAAQDAPQPRLPTLPLTAGMHVIQAEIAQTPTQQMIGMMHRRTMGTNEGMLFVYD